MTESFSIRQPEGKVSTLKKRFLRVTRRNATSAESQEHRDILPETESRSVFHPERRRVDGQILNCEDPLSDAAILRPIDDRTTYTASAGRPTRNHAIR